MSIIAEELQNSPLTRRLTEEELQKLLWAPRKKRPFRESLRSRITMSPRYTSYNPSCRKRLVFPDDEDEEEPDKTESHNKLTFTPLKQMKSLDKDDETPPLTPFKLKRPALQIESSMAAEDANTSKDDYTFPMAKPSQFRSLFPLGPAM